MLGAVGGACVLLVLILVTFIAGTLVCARRRLVLVDNIAYHTTTGNSEVRADRNRANAAANPYITTTTNEAYSIHHSKSYDLVTSSKEATSITVSANEACCPMASANDDYNVATSANEAYAMTNSSEGDYVVSDIISITVKNCNDVLVYDYARQT